MRSEYRYIHIHGDLPALSKPVTYAGAWRGAVADLFVAPAPLTRAALSPRPFPSLPAGFIYLIVAGSCTCRWVRGSVKARNAALMGH
jgi:hypothetical protein